MTDDPPRPRRRAARVLVKPTPRAPLLLRFAPIYFGSWGGGMCIGFPLALLDTGSFTIFEERVSGPEFAVRVYPVLLPMAVAAVVLAYGFHRQRPWTRRFTMVFLACGIVAVSLLSLLNGAVAEALTMLFAGPATLGVIFWYFYGKRNVDAYYRALATRAMDHPPSS